MQTLDEKAERLVRAGAVQITSRVLDSRVGPLPHVTAIVTGDTGVYDTVLGATGDNTCTCPMAMKSRRRCPHIRALLVYEKVGDLWAAQERALRRSEDRLETDGLPLADTKHPQKERFR